MWCDFAWPLYFCDNFCQAELYGPSTTYIFQQNNHSCFFCFYSTWFPFFCTLIFLQIAWLLIKRNAEYKPLQFLTFAFVYRIFEKLKSFEPPVSPTYTEDGEEAGRGLQMGKRLLRSLALVFGCIAVASLGYTGLLNLIEFTGSFIPAALYNNQELIITTATAVMLYILASYYRWWKMFVNRRDMQQQAIMS